MKTAREVKNMIIFAFILLFIGIANATESRMVDGKIQFPVANVNNRIAWTESEKQALIDDVVVSGTTTVNVVNITPTATEILVSTTITKFDNYSEFLDLVQKYDGGKSIKTRTKQDEIDELDAKIK